MNTLLRWVLPIAAIPLLLGEARAEGSKQLTPNNAGTLDVTVATNTRAGWLEHDANFTGNPNAANVSNSFLKPFGYQYNGTNNFSEDHRMYIRVKAGETLYYGVHRVNSGVGTANYADLTLTLRYGTGAGTQVQATTLTRVTTSTRQATLTTTQAGVIVDATQNQAGPLPNAGGYSPLTYTNNTGADRDFYVEFTQTNETALAENTRFSTYDYWDFTVRNAGGTEQPGRLYSKQWAFSSGAANGVFASTFSMYPLIPSAQQANRYYVKKFDLAGINPQNFFRFVTNSRGTTASATDFTVSRKSQTTLIDYPEYNNFVQNPDPAIWPSATAPGFTVRSVYPYCGGNNGALAFTTNGSEPGTLFITVDLDGTAGYQAGGRDVVVEKNVPAGTSTTVWNGLDGLGAPVPSGTAVQLGFKSGNSPVNFPMVDCENNADGFTIQDVRPTTGADFLFWDDTNLSTTLFPVPQTNLSGINSSGGVHAWGTASGAAQPTTDAGNNYVVNTFTFGSVRSFDQAFTLTYNCDFDGDGIANANDIDWDNDGISNTTESNGVNPATLTANGVPTYLDAQYVDPVFGAFRDINGDGLNDIFDLDLDGKPNFQDIDADGDGITDAIEANGGTAPANYDATTGRITGAVGANGMPDAAETAAESGTTKFPLTNTDNNGRADYLDIDADNDGIPDNIEAQTTAAYRAPSGTDTDGDGLDDRYDPTPGGAVTAGVAVPLTNTDGTDLPDYRDTNSDNDGRLDSVEGWDTDNDGVANTVATGNDADQDGLDDAYDIINTLSSGSLNNATNNRLPTFYPDVTTPGGDRDWRQNAVPVASNVTNAPAMLASNAITPIQSLVATDADDAANTLTYTIVALPPASQGVLYVNNVLLNTTNFPGLVLTAAQAAQLQFDPTATFVGNATFNYTAKDPAGQVSNQVTYTIPVSAGLSGYVYEDANYGGGAGRSRATLGTTGAVGRPGARVELYNSAGTFVTSTLTDANGFYELPVATGTAYTVRVVNNTVISNRPGATFSGTATTGYTSDQLGVQTFVGNNTARVGGEAPAKIDAAAGTTGTTLASLNTATTIAESQFDATTGTGATNTGPDFGFNFDVVVNTNDAGQGSLRQFINNSNALTNAGLAQAGQVAGKETSIFMISDGRTTGTIPAGTRAGVSGGASSGGVATITLSSTLPSITDANTTLTGLTQTALYGNTSLPVSEQTTGPEVIINFGGQSGLSVTATATNASIISLGLTGTNATGGSTTGALSILATGAVVQDNTMNNNGANMRINGVGGAIVSGNIFRDALASNSDGIELTSSSGNTITNNQFLNNAGYGIDYITGASNGNTISGNLFKNNGQNTSNGQTAGIGIRSNSSNNVISNNTFTANIGDGVTVLQGVNNVITQNSFYDNGDLAIDLTPASTTAYQGDGATLNDSGDGDGTGATVSGNGLINFPVIQSATIRNGNLIVTGFATANSAVEIYVSDNFTATPSFGEGKTFLASRTEGLAADDADATTGTYGPAAVNGLAQGTETGQQRFRFSIPLTAAQLAELNAGNAKLTATATLATLTNGNQGTSEFSGTATVLQAPTANNDFATTTANTAAPVTFAVSINDTPNATLDLATLDLDPNTAGIQTSFTTAQGTFTTTGAPAGSVTFTPANNTFTGNVTIPYVISNNQGIVSNQANLTVSVTPVLDLVTAITAPSNNSSVTAGAALSYTVTAQNASAIAANGVTQTLQLVPGLTSNGGTVSFTINGTASGTPTYDNVTGLVNFTPTPIALAANTTNTYVASFTKAPATGPITATANIGSTAGSNGPELNRNNNFATNTVNITPSYDVSTTITGSVDNANLAASVVSGGLVTYLVRTTNAAGSAAPAPGVIQTVTFDGNLLTAADGSTTGFYISNGGTAAYNSTTQKTVVTFPALATLPIGQTVTNTISFAAPALAAGSTFGATANVQANGAANPGDTNPGDTNAANNAATVSTTVTGATGAATNVYTTISSNQTVTTPGTTVTLTVVAGNRGAGSAATVVQQVQLPAGLTGPGAGGTVVVNNGTYNATTGIVTFTTITALTPQATNPLPFTIQFNAPAAGPVLATATVRQANADPVPADNVAEVKVDVTNTTDVATSLAGPATAAVGQAVTYNVTTSNLGPNTAFNVVQTVQLPAGLNANGGVTFGGATTGTYDNTTGVATFALANPLGAASRQVNTVTFTVPASVITDPSGATTGSNQLAVLAAVRTSTTETSSTNNSAATVMAVTPSADVVVAVSGPASALPGSPITYAVTATNNGPVTVASIVPTLQLPSGLTNSGGTVLVNGLAAGASYDNATGLVTFATVTNLPTGGSVANTVTVQMPDVTQLVPVARAQVGSATIDTNLSNNRADALTTVTNTSVVGTADLSTTVSFAGNPTSVNPGASVTVNATFSNATGGIAATDVVPRVQLPAGLANGSNVVTVAGGTGGNYNNTTGLVTWNSVPTLTAGTTLTGYNVTFVAPTSGSVTTNSFVASATADAVASNNARSATVTVTPQVDVTTIVRGPAAALAGSRVTYAVATINNGPSPSGTVTQTVTIPAGATNISFPAGSTQAPASNGTITITFPAINAMSVTPAGDVVNYVSFDAPTTSYTVSATASTTGDTNGGNNSASTSTTVDQAPTAYDVVNTLPSFLTGVIGSTAGPIKISPLLGADPDAGQTATLTYTLTSLPLPGTGVLYLDAAGTNPVATGVAYSAAQAANLYFDPRGNINPANPTYVGNVTFGYTTTDLPGLTSAPALYTIAVGKDERSVATNTITKGGNANQYQNNDPIVNIIDVNTVNYNTNGSLPFGKYLADRSVNPTPANNGIVNVIQTSGTLAPGLALDAATGQIYVLDRTKLVAGSYLIVVTTTDANGGTNTLTIPYTIGNNPLPVELTAFAATAKNLDALLTWSTASEKSNDHFDVERSLNGTDFVKIDEVKGQGTSTSATDYARTDAGIGAKANGLVYYRLKQVDTDGTSSYSPVRSVRFGKVVPAIALFPNPATTATSLDLTALPAGSYQVSVLDAAGRTVLHTTLDAGLAHALQLNTIASGSYTLLVRGTNGGQVVNLTKRLIKE